MQIFWKTNFDFEYFLNTIILSVDNVANYFVAFCWLAFVDPTIWRKIMKISKKAIALSVILATSTSSAQYYSIPNGYTKVDSAYGTSIYYSKDENTAVKVVDLELAYLKNLTIRKVENRYVFEYPGVYKQVSGAFSVVNGAFFDDEKSSTSGKISYPFTPGNDVWNDTDIQKHYV